MHPDILGWTAAALMVATFSCREARHLRPLAVATNLAFVGYGAAAGLMPVLALHLLLLPINLWRWMQVARLSRALVRQGLDRGARLLATVALASLPLMAGCGGGGDDQAPASSAPPPALPPAAPPAATSVAIIGPTGGSVTLSDGTLVTVPAGALAGEVTIEVVSEPATAPAVPAALKALGKIYAVTPHGTTFSKPVTVTLPFNPALAPAGVGPLLYKADGAGAAANEWREVSGAVVSGGTLRAEITSFSYLLAVAPLQLTEVWRTWGFDHLFSNGSKSEIAVGTDSSTAMAVVGSYYVGPRHLGDLPARALVFSGSVGSTYGMALESPASARADEPTGAKGQYYQVQVFRKRDAAATLSFVVTQAFIRVVDFDPRELDCNPQGGACRLLRGYLDFSVAVRDLTKERVFFYRHSGLSAFGAFDEWEGGNNTFSAAPIWRDRHIVVERSPTQLLVKLAEPVRVDVPLDDVPVGHEIVLSALVEAHVSDRRQKESLIDVFFRDPQDPSKSGLDFEYTGLDKSPVRDFSRPVFENLEAPACVGAAEPLAGTLQFESASPQLDEGSGLGAHVYVTRTGGTRGEVSVRMRTGDGTAVPGRHYQPVSRVVAFADGEDGRRAVFIPLLNDGIDEGARTVRLELHDVRGCAALGAPAAATLTVADDDFVKVVSNYRIGGTVSGLAGSGLVLEDRAQFIELPITANGGFEFNRNYSAGAAYDVRVKTPPTNPVQVCTVTRGSGVVGSGNITDIAVDCTTPPPPTGLDLGFGAGTGKVTAGPAGVAKAVALLPDGRILAAIGNSVARYLADGTLDTTFGSNGSVGSVVGPTSFGAEILDLAVQADGRIVAAGTARGSSFSTLAYDFAVARLNADGSRDPTFNGGNALQVDWVGAPDRASRVLLQPDGKIVLAGQATTVYVPATGSQDSAMALVRLNADGSLDTTFGSGGRAVTSFGLLEAGQAAALQPDGKIVIAGRVADNLADSHLGAARFNVDGTPDASFGSAGQVRYNEVAEATALALQPDGRVLLALAHNDAGNTGFGVVRLNADGSVDTTFGASGLARLEIGPGVDAPLGLALQVDGRIVAVGSALSTATSFDFVVARFLPTGAVDTGFGAGGFYSLDLFRGRDGAYDVLVQPDGKLLVSGSAGSGLSTQPLLMRFHP